MSAPSYMYREIHEIPQVVQWLLDDDEGAIKTAADRLRDAAPALLVTFARGSSDHAAMYLKYACELTQGLPVVSIGPSLSSIYRVELKLDQAFCIAISQSGQSPDIVQSVTSAKRTSAGSIGFTNDPTSPLAQVSNSVVPLLAGPERSVPATKTFVASLVAGLSLLAHWKEDADLHKALARLPDALAQAVEIDWPDFRAKLGDRRFIYVLGRGLSLGIAQEAALKLKETCQFQAEAYSAAEVMHGPISVLTPGFPILAFVSTDPTEAGFSQICDQLSEMGACVFSTSHNAVSATALEFVATGHPLTDPISRVVSFYSCVERLARDRGKEPDQPRNLMKVTKTL